MNGKPSDSQESSEEELAIFYVVWERRKNKARVYVRKQDAIYDHVRFRKTQKVWFLDRLTLNQVMDRLKGVEVVFV